MPDNSRTVKRPPEKAETRKAITLRDRVRSLRGSPRDLLRLLASARPYRARLAVALVSLFIASGLGLAFPKAVQWLIDAAFIEHDSARLNSLALMLVALFTTQAA